MSFSCIAAKDAILTMTGSRRLITYRRIPDAQVDQEAMKRWETDKEKLVGKTVDELNPFRKAYFNKFEVEN
jgi:tRNA (guanine10-N2)-methyltransferase